MQAGSGLPPGPQHAAYGTLGPGGAAAASSAFGAGALLPGWHQQQVEPWPAEAMAAANGSQWTPQRPQLLPGVPTADVLQSPVLLPPLPLLQSPVHLQQAEDPPAWPLLVATPPAALASTVPVAGDEPPLPPPTAPAAAGRPPTARATAAATSTSAGGGDGLPRSGAEVTQRLTDLGATVLFNKASVPAG